MQNKTIKDFWNEFSFASIAQDAPIIQHEEMNRAFYSGAAALMGAIVTALNDEDADHNTLMEDWMEELSAFSKTLIRTEPLTHTEPAPNLPETPES